MTDNFIAATTEPIAELGTIVNDWKPASEEIGDDVADQHPGTLPLDLEKVILWFKPEQYDALQRAAEFSRVSLEEYVANIVVEALTTKVGTPRIFSPSSLSGNSTGMVTGFSNSVSRG
jgi:hypothetical protein